MRRAALAAVLALSAPTFAYAQSRARVEILLPARELRTREAPAVRAHGLLTESGVAELLTSGFPARVHFKLERWRSGRWFDDLRSTSEWDVIVRHDPLAAVFRISRVRGTTAVTIGQYARITAADTALAEPVRIPIGLPRPGERGYYSVRIEVEMLSVTDLDELERWLRGELSPAVRGEQNPGTAITRGIRTLVVRLLGGEKRRYVARSAVFRG